MDLQKLVEEVYESQLEEKQQENGKLIAQAITRNDLKLIDVIEALQSRLTSTALDDRIVGMSLLGRIFENLERNFLTETELLFIVDFLCDRLKDQHQVTPKVIQCILAVVKYDNLPDGSCTNLLDQLFQEANIQSHSQRHRHDFFLILQHILKSHLAEITIKSSDFVMNFLHSMDGEKDPRNLLILFDIIPTILTHFPLGPFVEDFFEVVSMYFPIDFRPIVGGPDAEVTSREELARNLHICMSQTNQFSEYLIPLALEKLESSLVEAKLDSLNLLATCCERSYVAEDLKPHFAAIWHALRREIFMGGNDDVEKAANSFIQTAFKVLSENKEIMETALQLIFSECKHHLSEPELRLSQPASKILSSIAAASDTSCAQVTSMTMSLLYEQFTVKISNPERRGILDIMITMMTGIRSFPKLSLSSILGNWDEILWMWFSLLTHSHAQFVLLSLRAFYTLLENERESPNFLEGDELSDLNKKSRDLLQAHLLTILQRKEDEDSDLRLEIRSLVIASMEVISAEFSNEYLETSVPQLLKLIRTDNDGTNEEKMKIYFLTLASSSASLPVGKVIIPSLVKILVEAKKQNGDYSIFIETLLTIVEKGPRASEDKQVFVDCVSKHLDTLVEIADDVRSYGKPVLYAQVAGIIRKLVQSSSSDKQQEIIGQFWNKRVLAGQTEEIQGVLAEAFLASVRPTVEISKKDELIERLIEQVLAENEPGTEQDEMDALANIRLLANFLNKAEGDQFSKFLTTVEKLFNETLKIPEEPSPDKEDLTERVSPAEEAINLDLEKIVASNLNRRAKNLVTFFIWTVKSLAMRGHDGLSYWIHEKMIRLLNSTLYGKIVSDGFSVVISDSEESLNENSFCNYRFLYKQRIFQLSVPKLVRGYRVAKHDMKENFIRALTGQLRHVPQTVLKMELNNVVPLLVGSLSYDLPLDDEKDEIVILRNTPNAPLLLSSLTALQELLSPSSSTVEKTSPVLDYYLDIIPRLLRLAQYKGFMQVRILALKCLQQCAKFPTHVIVPTKEQVVRDLRPCLDDPKRLVRKESVLCRNIWTLTNAPGGV